MTETVLVAARFCGPPGSGNGGYVAGLAAKALGAQTTEVTLRAPPPLDTPMEVVHEGGELALMLGEREIARAQRGELETPPEPAPSLADAAAASAGSPWRETHLIPGCFVCGPARGAGDGLRIFSGPLDAKGAEGGVAASWTPGADLAEDDDRVALEFLWAALDCPSYFALPRAGEMIALLGRMTARVLARPEPGAALAIAARAVGSEGRKHASRSALYDGEGRLLAHAACLWIELKEQPRL